nr:SDR family NAD(P)-dependent oxidoreductase [Micromonospora sp. DSM 115978]
MDLGLAGAAVVVSGGSKGMGRAAAECFASEGARVAVLARGKDALDDTVTALRRLGAADAVALAADLTDAGSVASAFDEVARRWGTLN